MVFKENIFCVLFYLALPYSAQADFNALNLPDNSVQQHFISAPIIYNNNFETEHERLGYQLPIEPNPISFSSDGRAYIRQKNGVVRIDNRDEWSFTSFLSAVSDASGQLCSGVDMYILNDLRIVFDKDGYAYTPVLAYSGKIKRAFLFVKFPGSEQWRAYALPIGNPRMEWFSGAKMLDGPPAVLIYGDKTISVVDVQRDQDRISISKPQEISKDVLAIAWLGSGGSIVVRSGDWIHTVFALGTPPESMKGTPEVWARWSPQKNLQYPPQLLGMSVVTKPDIPDEHDYPVVVQDSQGRLHAVLGAHNRAFQYTHTLSSANKDQITWTKPTVIEDTNSDKEPALEPWFFTYPELVCDSKDTLHLVARQGTQEKGLMLVYLRKEPGKNWTRPRELVVSSHRGYLNCYHRLMKDSKDRLFLTYYVYFNYFTDEQMQRYQKKYPKEKLIRGESQGYGHFNYEGVQRHGPYLLISEDGGNSWRMAVMDDIKPQRAMNIKIAD